MNEKWLLCPVCGNKTRLKIRTDTVLENFPLFCPKCKQETLIHVEQLNMSVIKEPDANASGKVPDERYEKMSAKFEAEQAALIDTLDALEKELAEQEEQAFGVDSFLDTVRRYTEIEALTPAIVHEFIDKIVIYEPEQARGNRRQNVEIIYNKIGAVDLNSWESESADTSA